MKPLKLTMQAFGPFAGTQEVDFTRLGENPLFLINGTTGAGKTTILDGICYALYGSTTGDEREGKQMRCDFADASVTTVVTLEFALGDKCYRVEREPDQEVAKLRGEGTTEKKAKVALYEITDDGSKLLANKAKEVSEHIENLLGLNASQFRQVMVLPQGKFRELLTASSDQREKILASLFQTHVYEQIQKKLAEMASGIYRQHQEYKQRQAVLLQSAGVDTEEALLQQQKELQPQLEGAQKQKDAADERYAAVQLEAQQAKALESAFAEHERLQQELRDCMALSPQVAVQQQELGLAQQASKILPAWHAWQKAETALGGVQKQQQHQAGVVEAAGQALQAASARAAMAVKAFAAVDGLKAEKIKLEGYRPLLQKLANARAALATTEKQKNSAGSALQKQREAVKASQEKLQALADEIARLRFEPQELADATAAQQKYEQWLIQKQACVRLQAAHDQLQRECQLARERHGACQAKVDAAEDSLKRLKLGWHAGQALLLARELREGEPCLVCGSTEHPSPAQPGEGHALVEQEEVEDGEAQLKKLQAELARIQEDVAGREATLKAKEIELKDSEVALGEAQALALGELERRLEQARSQVAALQQRSQALQARQQDHDNLANAIAAAEEGLQTLEEKSSQADMACMAAGKDVSATEEALPGEWREAGKLDNEIAHLQAEVGKLTAAKEAAAQVLKNASDKHVESRTSADMLAEQLRSVTLECSNMRDAWQKALAAAGFADEPAFRAASRDEPQQQALQEAVDSWKSRKAELEGSVKQQQQQVQGKAHPDMVALQQKLEKAVQQKQEAEQAWRELTSQQDRLDGVARQLQAGRDEAEKLKAEYQVYGTLSEVAGGAGGNRISLQRFVLGVLLDDVLIMATQRLLRMSKGRYHLQRLDAATDARRTFGLDLAVFDEYTGKQRPVATLSGGESFMAALSLALGLSDVVQGYAGGIRLDTLFIDEGFGSLDTESLDEAIKTLVDLQATGRTIGIISHVTELKEQMPLRVDVLSDRTGSSIRLVV